MLDKLLKATIAQIYRQEKSRREITATSSPVAFTSSEESTSGTSGTDDADIISLTETATTSVAKRNTSP